MSARDFNAVVAKASIVTKPGRATVARILVSVSGDRLPDGADDIDREREVTDYGAFKAATGGHDGAVVWAHRDEPSAVLAGPKHSGHGSVEWVSDDKKRESFAAIETDNAIVVDLVSRGLPLEASWSGPVRRKWEMGKRSDGSRIPVKRIFPKSIREVTLVWADGGGAMRRGSKTLATATKAAGANNEEETVDELMKIVSEAFGASAPEVQAAFVVALYGMLPDDQKAGVMEAMKPAEKKPEDTPAPTPEPEKAAPAPVLPDAMEAFKAEMAASKAASDARFDLVLAELKNSGTALAALSATVTTISNTPQTIVMPMPNAAAVKAGDAGVDPKAVAVVQTLMHPVRLNNTRLS